MKAFFTKNLFLKFFSLFVAIVLWASVKGGEEQENTMLLNVEVINVPANLVLTSQAPEELRIKLRGPRTTVHKLLKEYPRVYPLDVSSARAGWQSFPAHLSENVAKMPRGVNILNLDPYIFRLRFQERERKIVAVKLNLVGQPDSPYVLGKVEYQPQQITVSGPLDELKQLSHVLTDPIDLNGAKNSINGKVGLEQESKLIRLEGERLISVNVEIVEK